MLCARAPGHSGGADALLAAGGVVARALCWCAPPPKWAAGYGPYRVKPRASSVPAWARLAGPGAGACRRCVGGVLRSPLARAV